ncbi:MAG TPA: hypothetical protein VMV56_12775 [Williamwhitmania sp.]|nr:hypothetical protein [Williamwhitmania sp.]
MMNILSHINPKRLHLAVIGMAILLSSCHSNYLNYKIDFSNNFAWKGDSSAFAFLAVQDLYRRPVGIATFPDGGMSLHEYSDAALYYFNIKENKLNKAVDFSDLSALHSLYSKLQFQYIKIKFTDSLLYYRLSKPYDVDIKNFKKRFKNKEDSLKLSAIINKTSNAYAYNINTKKISVIDSATFNVALGQVKIDRNIRKRSKEYLTKLSYADWGIVLKDIYPQSKKTYMEYIVYMQGNSSIREAVFEQIIPNFTPKEIQIMLNDMDAYKTKLDKKDDSSFNYKDHSNKLSYDEYYESTYKRLRKFL